MLVFGAISKILHIVSHLRQVWIGSLTSELAKVDRSARNSQGFLRGDTVGWFRNPARKPVDMVNIPLFTTGFSTIPGGWEWDF